jgi:probable rRNA maturation factor
MPTQVRRNAPGSPTIAVKHIRMLADAMLESLDLQNAELSVLLTNDKHIQELNREHRSKDRPTDVLSFGVERDLAAQPFNAPNLLGDIVISLDTAARQAMSRRRPLAAEIRWLLAHGILHLMGFDHATAAQKKRMVAWTGRLVRAAALPEAAKVGLPHAKPGRAVKRLRRVPKVFPGR